ncbi:MAG: hypothetical protein OQK32_02420 [Gammaproteobacteria bacterium]|nr:hypothetical protein [Gammaproteobacteria bacterium]
MKKVLLSALLLLSAQPIFAEQDAAEAMVASKKTADMTYRQLMEIMGSASATIQEGIMRENKQMVIEGVTFILTHPAPNHKPWMIMKEQDQAGFKSTLLTFDKTLDEQAIKVREAVNQSDWARANSALSELNSSCIACHAMWRAKVK